MPTHTKGTTVQDFEFNISGLDELQTKLKTVTNELQHKSGRAALRKAANLIAKTARQKARKIDDPDTGRSIAKNVGVRWSRQMFRRTGNLSFRIGVLGGGQFSATAPGNPDTGAKGPTPHWHLVELGTRHAAAQPFLRPAGIEKAEAAADLFVREYGKALDKVTSK